jgi:hypothetical protein
MNTRPILLPETEKNYSGEVVLGQDLMVIVVEEDTSVIEKDELQVQE